MSILTALWIIACVLALLAPAAASARADIVSRTLDNGDQIQFDGTYYDFRDAEGRRMIKLWVPPGDRTVRGVLVMGHGGGGGDSRGSTRDENMQALASQFNFAVAGLHNFPGRDVYENGARAFFGALDAFAGLGEHPELSNIPVAPFGSSNGGGASYGFANAYPERTLCFVTNVMWRFSPTPPAEGAENVPGIIVVGRFDTFGRGQAGVESAREAVLAARERGARWTFIVEDKGHEDGIAFDVYAQLLEQSVKLRYPDDADPKAGPVQLKALPEESGWLVGLGDVEGVLPPVAPYNEFEGDKATAGWVADETLAHVFQVAATRNSPLLLGVQEVDRPYNANTNPGTMWSIGGPLVEPGRELTLVADVQDIPDWTKLEFFNGADKLGEVAAPQEPTLRITVPSDEKVMCLTAMASTDNSDVRHPAGPFYMTVVNPQQPYADSAESPAYEDTVGKVGSQTARDVPPDYRLPDNEAVLVAFGLSEAQEKSFGTDDRTVASFWENIPDEHAAVMDKSTHAQEGTRFSIVTLADARMTMKAAHSARGLYLYFEVRDNEFVEPDPISGKYNETDTVDVVIDAQPSSWLNDPANAAQAINAGWSLFLSSVQYQVAFGARNAPDAMRRLAPDPFDLDFETMHTIKGVEREHGMVVRHIRLDRLRRAQEWFLPWTELGRDAGEEPTVGTRLGFAPAYKDFDVSGESAAAEAKALRWVDHTSPWHHSIRDGEGSRGWGDIEIGPMIDQLPDTTAQ